MKIILGCDVDPELPVNLRAKPAGNVWDCLRNLDKLVDMLGADLPPITWIIRADASVRFATGQYDSGYLERANFWDSLRSRGHELGWHMHLASFKPRVGAFGFDPEPEWLDEAHGSLSARFPIRSTRTGWDYSNTGLMRDLDRLGVLADFSALPGSVAWFRIGPDSVRSDWLRCPESAYHPSASDYQSEGELRIVEIPITPFRQAGSAVVKRAAWRAAHGVFSHRGLTTRTRQLWEHWDGLPECTSEVWAFYFHPDDLRSANDYANVCRNIEALRGLPGAEFVTASVAAEDWEAPLRNYAP